ncbi:MAG TPA: single-stranded-DNA-specific exonuclease RecJ, partial [Pirellulaceae bacterium]
MAKRWRVHPFDEGRVHDLAQAAGVPSVVAQLLICRGVQRPEIAREFLEAKLSGLRDPDLLPGLPDAVTRMGAAIRAGQRITVYGDYDADGICGTAILARCLKGLGAECD